MEEAVSLEKLPDGFVSTSVHSINLLNLMNR